MYHGERRVSSCILWTYCKRNCSYRIVGSRRCDPSWEVVIRYARRRHCDRNPAGDYSVDGSRDRYTSTTKYFCVANHFPCTYINKFTSIIPHLD